MGRSSCGDEAGRMSASASLPASSAPASSSWGRRYRDRWRRVPRELAYLVVAFVIAVTVFSAGISVFSAGIGLVPLFLVGVFLIIAALYLARGASIVDRALLRWAGRSAIPEPDWRDEQARTGFFGWLRALLANGHYWIALLWALLPNFVLATVSWSIMVAWVGGAVGGPLQWLVDRIVPPSEIEVHPFWWFLDRIGLPLDGIDPALVDNLVAFVLGLVFLFTFPYVIGGLVSLHHRVASAMLGPFRSEALAQELAGAEAMRQAAVSAEDSALRRLERDIHDGPQQRLVRLQMDLAAADRRMGEEPEEARRLLAEAGQQARDALEELRALSRGFAPPILLDRGLVAALESAAVRSSVAVRVRSDLPAETVLPAEVERNAYFIASEALANAVKHAQANSVDIAVGLDAAPRRLVVSVRDDGRGGAVAVPDHGLVGLEDRVRGLGGSFELTSPVGGPTVLTARLPW